MEHTVPLTPCPYCDYQLDAATSFDEDMPSPGDLSICASCASVLVFTETLRVRGLTSQEWLGLPEDIKNKLRLCQRKIREADRRM